MDMNMLLKLWAKTGENSDNFQYHPLLCHMLDVAAVAGLVWDQSLNKGLKRRLENALGNETRTLVMFISGAHDIGKASPGFQKRVPELSKYVEFPFSMNDQYRLHGIICAHVLKQFLGPGTKSCLLGQISGGHHGVFPRAVELRMGRDTLGNIVWEESRKRLLEELARSINLDINQTLNLKTDIADPFIVPFIAGFISVVDWIGSNQHFFPCASEIGKPFQFNVGEYFMQAQGKARVALNELGWIPQVVFAAESPFERVFPALVANSLQSSMNELVSKQNSPYLMIIEASMGNGKTEAALYAADLALCRGFARGMYVAMPTQATGNAMFRRVMDDYLRQRGHKGKLNLQLVHGNALLAQMAEAIEGEILEFKPKNIDGNNKVSDMEAQSWFTAKKRPLLAPFGVGTIDQSLLSVLQTRHWFVRLFGLAGKVIIFDEVHAYDVYMSTILERLLQWLAEMDCTVILLSATLPEAKRKVLINAYSGRKDGEYKRYPRITLAQARYYPNRQSVEAPVCKEVVMGSTYRVDLHFDSTDLEFLTAALAKRLEQGGCAAVICNTVDRAIDVFKHLRTNLKETECLIFHARTLQKWRRQREVEVLIKFGKGEKQGDGTYVNQHRPKRAVLVATQVIEQSLDLDFDLMISDIAPIDLLLQRSGRLHRHLRLRPKGLETPKFIVLCDAMRNGLPPKTFGKSIEFVYNRYILLKTWLTIRELVKIEIPNEIENLVEAVYGSDETIIEAEWLEELKIARKQMELDQSESEKAANRLLVAEPGDPSDIVEQFNSQLLDDEDPEVHKSIRAATREGDPSITVVMVDSKTVIGAGPTLTEVRNLLDSSVKLSHRGIYHTLFADGIAPKEWAKNAHLQHVRLLRLNEMNQHLVGGFLLTVDEKLGIVIEKEGKDNG